MKIHFNLHVAIKVIILDNDAGYEQVQLLNPNSVKKSEKTSRHIRENAEVTGYIKNRSYFIGGLEQFEKMSSRERMGFDYIVLKLS